MSEDPGTSKAIARRERSDALGWGIAATSGLALAALAVRLDAELGTASAPLLGRFDVRIRFTSILAPAVAIGVIALTRNGVFDRLQWWKTQISLYVTALVWALALAVVDGWSGLTRALGAPETYRADVRHVGDDPIGYLGRFTTEAASHSPEARGHPPGPVLLLWMLDRLGITNQIALGALLTALATLTVPLVLAAVRDSCGEVVARRYAPVLVLAPYAIWVTVSLDAIVAVIGASAVLAGVRASRRRVRGWPSIGWALTAGLLLGLAALYSYSAAWLGLSLVCLYFARRRPLLNTVTGAGALIPLLAAGLAGFGWVDGLLAAEADYRLSPYRSVLWWSVLSLVVLLLAAGPALYASARKVRNTPAWPFLVGAVAAVLFTIVAGLARGGGEQGWLAFFPWLTVAAVAPQRQAGPPVPAPLLLVGIGAAMAIIIEATLVTPS